MDERYPVLVESVSLSGNQIIISKKTVQVMESDMNENSKNLAIIGASYLQLPLIRKAREMGYTAHVFAWKANDPGETEADYFYPISIVEKEKILEECRKIGICGICSIASDLAMLTVNYVAEKLELPANSAECTKISTNKYEMRQAFARHNVPSCQSQLIADEEDLRQILEEDLSFPKIVKPTDRSGSRGIFLVHTAQELSDAVQEAVRCSFEKKVLVEDYIEGEEYSVEYISQNGKHHLLAVTQKLTTGAPHFIETGHNEPSGLDERMIGRVSEVIEQALDALQITTGASHSEIRIDEQENIRIIEIGGRMGGDCIGSHLVEHSTGYDYVRMVIECAVGEPIDFERKSSVSDAHVRFIFTEEDWQQYQELSEKLPADRVETVFLNLDDLGKATDSSNRAGCYLYYDSESD